MSLSRHFQGLVVAFASSVISGAALANDAAPQASEPPSKEAPTPLSPTPSMEDAAPAPTSAATPAPASAPAANEPAPPVVEASNPMPGVAPIAPVRPSDPGSSTSANKQFIIYGADLRTRSVYTDIAADVLESLNRLLRDQSKTPATPIIINLKAPPNVSMRGPAVSSQVSQLAHGGFHLQITVQLRLDLKKSAFESELIRLLIAERILRENKTLSTSRTKILPDWLLTGMTQAQEFKRSAQPSLVFASVFKSGQIFGVDQILSADPKKMDSLNKVIFEASTCALVLTLLDQPEGQARFGQFLSSLATDSREDRDLLQSFFPALGSSANSLEKWWSLQMATLATPSIFESMTIQDTEAYLEQALKIRYFDDESSPNSKPNLARSNDSSRSNASTSEAEVAVDSPSQEEEPKKRFGIFRRGAASDEASEPEPSSASEKKDSTLPGFIKNPFGRKKDVFLPFFRKKNAEDEAAASPQAPEPSLSSEPQSPVDALERKPNNSRGVSRKPETHADSTPLPPVPNIAIPEDPTVPLPAIDIPGLTPMPMEDASGGFTLPPGMLPPIDDASLPVPGSLPTGEPNLYDATSPTPVSVPSILPETKNEVLTLEDADFSEPHAIALSEYKKVFNRKDRSAILRKNIHLLNAIKMRAHPLYKDLIADYTTLFLQLSSGKDQNAPALITRFENTRQQISGRARAVQNHLDWYEANHTQHYSDSFEEYLRVRDRIEDETPARRDAVSRYLNTISKEYE